MGALLTAVLALLGSSAAAAWMTNSWQRRRFLVETLTDGFRRLVDARAELTRAVSTCVSLLRIADASGKIWNYQRVRYQDCTETARAQAVILDAAHALNAIAQPWSTAAGARLAAAAHDTLKELSVVFEPIGTDPDLKDGVTVRPLHGSPGEAADRLALLLQKLAEAEGELTKLTACQRERVMEVRWGVPLASAVLALLAGAASYWFVGAWSVDVRPDRVVWVHSITGAVEVSTLPPPERSDAASPAPAAPAEAVGVQGTVKRTDQPRVDVPLTPAAPPAAAPAAP